MLVSKDKIMGLEMVAGKKIFGQKTLRVKDVIRNGCSVRYKKVSCHHYTRLEVCRRVVTALSPDRLFTTRPTLALVVTVTANCTSVSLTLPGATSSWVFNLFSSALSVVSLKPIRLCVVSNSTSHSKTEITPRTPARPETGLVEERGIEI